MFTPILDIVKYIKLFQDYLGKRIYLIFVLGLFAALAEGIGILMLLPLWKHWMAFLLNKN